MRATNENNLLIKLWMAFLWRSRLWDFFYKLFWRSESVFTQSELLYEKTVTDLGKLSVAELSDIRVQAAYEQQNIRWKEQNEVLVALTVPVWIEPGKGLVLTGKGSFAEETRSHPYIYPDVRWQKNYGSDVDVVLPEAYYFDGYVGESYYHFFSEVLSAFFTYKQIALSDERPIVIRRKIYETKYFQYLLENTELEQYKFVVLEEQSICVKKLYIARGSFSKEYWQGVRSWIGAVPKNEKKRRVFLNRANGVGRNIKNIKEICALLEQYDFEIIDTEYYSIEEQRRLMNEVEYLIGIHGAGLTNMLFLDPAKAKVLEINPMFQNEEGLRPHYYWLAACLELPYDCIMGETLDRRDKFYLDLELLKKYL
jgi:capsular polysaccharide biosynthesis protein